jgi:hypothetical protein
VDDVERWIVRVDDPAPAFTRRLPRAGVCGPGRTTDPGNGFGDSEVEPAPGSATGTGLRPAILRRMGESEVEALDSPGLGSA